eukprot:TRINITY_DN10251_c0_g7_i1.p1 TRINITY_DN10251_c0_g7~~TRINITY_DN10251_c0_g7_i1.p1  ORF type:complete len:749 (+),score=108.09 TRINITY_DN10251_c0_g7_i1:54-2300(+)
MPKANALRRLRTCPKLDSPRTKPICFRDNATSEARSELSDLSDKIQKSVCGAVVSIGDNIQQAVIQEIRTVVKQLHLEVSKVSDLPEENSLPQPKTQLSGGTDILRMQGNPCFAPFNDSTDRGRCVFPTLPQNDFTPMKEMSRFGSNDFATPSNCVLDEPETEVWEKGSGTNDLGAPHFVLPMEPPPTLNMNVAPIQTALGAEMMNDENAPLRSKRVSTHTEIESFEQLSEDSHLVCAYSMRDIKAENGRGRLSIGRELAKSKSKRKNVSIAGKPLCSMSVQDILNSPRFDNLVGLVIMVNAFMIGVQTHHTALNRTASPLFVFEVFEGIFAVWFTAELSLRIYVAKLAFFVPKGGGWFWNYFDFLVVFAQLLELFVQQLAKNSSIDVSKFRLLRVLRILRLVRILRVVRVLHLISELRTIVSSIVGSVRSLGWTCVLLFLMIYIVGVYFTQSITEHLVEQQTNGKSFTQGEEDLGYFFSSLFRAILSLFQAMSGGLDWNDLGGPLFTELGAMQGLCFTAFIAFALLALMNVVTGVFVQTALNSARTEEDAFVTDQIYTLFSISEKQEQTITLEEIEASLSDPRQAKEWQAIGVGEADAKHLFQLLDIESSGRISFEEFLGGALRLNGDAKAIDLLTVMQEHRKSSDQIYRSFAEMKQHIDAIAVSVERLETVRPGFGRVPYEDVLFHRIEFLVEAARDHSQHVRRIPKLERSLATMEESLVKLTSLETALSLVPYRASAVDDLYCLV